jgi:hypothetical protein
VSGIGQGPLAEEPTAPSAEQATGPFLGLRPHVERVASRLSGRLASIGTGGPRGQAKWARSVEGEVERALQGACYGQARRCIAVSCQAASGPPVCCWSISHLGGRPRLGRSVVQSIRGSRRSSLVVSSVTAVLPPQIRQRRRHQATNRLAERESAGWNKIGALGGHWFDRAVPTGRAHKRHVTSAMKIR